MFSRRLLRAKALQYLYAYYMQKGTYPLLEHHTETAPDSSAPSTSGIVAHLVKILAQDVRCVQHMHRLTWSILWVWAHPNVDQKPTPLANNRLLRIIWGSPCCPNMPPTLSPNLRAHTLEWYYIHLTPHATYQNYIAQKTTTEADDKGILHFLLYKTQLEKLLGQSSLALSSLHQSSNFPALWQQLKADVKNARHNTDAWVLPDCAAADRAFFRTLVEQTLTHSTTFKAHIRRYAPHWDEAHLLPIDQLLLQLALCEIIHMPDIPSTVSINEYLALAKQYSMPKSYQFINGILDKYVKNEIAQTVPSPTSST